MAESAPEPPYGAAHGWRRPAAGPPEWQAYADALEAQLTEARAVNAGGPSVAAEVIAAHHARVEELGARLEEAQATIVRQDARMEEMAGRMEDLVAEARATQERLDLRRAQLDATATRCSACGREGPFTAVGGICGARRPDGGSCFGSLELCQ